MASLLACLLLATNFGRVLSVTCSAPFVPKLGACLHSSSQKMTWCAAQAYCVQKGGELVTGATYLALNGRTDPGMPEYFYIGLTDLLEERGKNRSGWRWTDGSLTPPSSNLTWNNGEPGNVMDGVSDCVMQCLYKYLCDVSCRALPQWRAVPMCQPRAASPKSNHRSHLYEVAGSFATGLTSIQTADGNQCSELFKGVRSVIACALLCSGAAHEWCIHFYYNNVTEECRIVHFTDSAINVGNAANWKKYNRK